MKQEIIEEMARHLCLSWKNMYDSCEQCTEKLCCEYLEVAEELTKAGYRKIPENAVVIEKTEYDKLISLADECIDWRGKNCNVAELPKEKAVVLTREEMDNYANSCKNCHYVKEVETLRNHIVEIKQCHEWDIERIHKETAEKFAERLKDALFDLGNVVTEKDIDEIAKEFTEGSNG